ncbi:ABC transporter ATP-binding protein [Ruficoccus amylovorans]|uniref:ABC transporter ATP-binding protein n=1 Tax=Ruficoccus amylovorans TaxID=1804625 RepID=A0A842HE70_9BACT|nr:ABC transporter ATP-binding protein [Ruficoccus amylovorans]MBC2594813.1 ABC transporter ATP-binding protein [Ruficoccus amylovorans]
MDLLKIEDLKISFHNRERTLEAVKGIGFALQEGETLAVVGESGSGKSVTALSLTRLLPPPPGCRVSGKILYDGRDVMAMSPRELRGIRGRDIAYIFQDASTSLNPVFTIGNQIAEAIRLHFPQEKDVTGRVIEALRSVGIRDPEKRHRAYPHELSGGMQQRVMIAMALACEPRILVADEPTTALDVTIQKQIMDLLADLRQRRTMSIILITHNFGIVSGFADRVVVMFRGEIVEAGPTEEVLRNPQHPYTKALIACIPRLGAHEKRLTTIDYATLGS